ncbi:hypothetical protein SAMN02745163_03491 [Clostridium cavendishii DSM 21758]|uniref:Uncharacterized protein n=1 Tax=Clostridium cavendishii DSM 21758 TaxID=1121302 RepID=A0A1M6QYE3_9CLOT|nr:hypothetical protein [Clostridium cavendishii]SHK25108.1 hypothetical protein SAMN02745163_03491 [Clostridium cavendishii DSM 21758]
MSLFLGKIHYLLYNKIQANEDLLEEILDYAETKNLPTQDIKKKLYESYGYPERSALETVIDEGNIHGWLQNKIESVEDRTASLITSLINDYGIELSEIENIYFENGKNTMKNIEKVDFAPSDLFGLIFSYLLEGMPCDRINRLVSNSETEIVWETTECIHRKHWDKVSGDVENFYVLREEWIKGFINEAGNRYTYDKTEDGYNRIRKEE